MIAIDEEKRRVKAASRERKARNKREFRANNPDLARARDRAKYARKSSVILQNARMRYTPKPKPIAPAIDSRTWLQKRFEERVF